MRFDNPIYEHGFIFPDIADFPDVKNEPRYEGNGNEQSVSIMKEAIQKSDLNMFQNGYQYYMKNVDTKLFNKLNTMFQFYANFDNLLINFFIIDFLTYFLFSFNFHKSKPDFNAYFFKKLFTTLQV